jgi:hypothetical protein
MFTVLCIQDIMSLGGIFNHRCSVCFRGIVYEEKQTRPSEIGVKYDDIGMYIRIIRRYGYICKMPIKMKVVSTKSLSSSDTITQQPWHRLPGHTKTCPVPLRSKLHSAQLRPAWIMVRWSDAKPLLK